MEAGWRLGAIAGGEGAMDGRNKKSKSKEFGNREKAVDGARLVNGDWGR